LYLNGTMYLLIGINSQIYLNIKHVKPIVLIILKMIINMIMKMKTIMNMIIT